MYTFTGRWCDYCLWGGGAGCPPITDKMDDGEDSVSYNLPCEDFVPTCDPEVLGIVEFDGRWYRPDDIDYLLLVAEMEG